MNTYIITLPGEKVRKITGDSFTVMGGECAVYLKGEPVFVAPTIISLQVTTGGGA